jgi:hypothetical protein
LLAGARVHGGPLLLQLWRRDPLGLFERVAGGDQPVFSEVLGAWLVPTQTTLEIADDREGLERWPTWEDQMLAERAEKERERAEKERERAEKERERAARLDVEQRLAQLERKLGG